MLSGLGGEILGQLAHRCRTDGDEIEFRRTTMLMAGATGSYHFDGGVYFTGSAGLLWWNTFRGKAQQKDVTVEPHSGPGFGLVPGIGYEWLGVERSMGVLFQVVAGRVQATDDSGTEWASYHVPRPTDRHGRTGSHLVSVKISVRTPVRWKLPLFKALDR
jgi:hypothetical protein